MTSLDDKGAELLRLHTDPELLILVNVWDAVTAKVIAGTPGARALATASHSVAATFGYPDGEQMPLELMIDMVERIAAAVDLPVTADLEGGYGEVDATIRMAIEAGAVGANIEDEMSPFDEAVGRVRRAVAAGEAEGVTFVLNARTDAFLKAGARDPEQVLRDAIDRGRAFLDAGAACVFVPGRLDATVIGRLVEAFGERKLSVVGLPGVPPAADLARLGVARLSYGPIPQRIALTALQDAARGLLSGGPVPSGIRPLN